jgi:hypothetical protein
VSNRHNPRPRPAASIKVGQITRPVHPRSPNDSFDLSCYCNAKAAARPTTAQPCPSSPPKNMRLWLALAYNRIQCGQDRRFIRGMRV